MDDERIIELYWQREDSAISETDKKYGKYCHKIAYNILLFNYVILFNEELGYMTVVTGDYDMELIEKIAENLEFRTTEETVSYEDFASHNIFFDGGNG